MKLSKLILVILCVSISVSAQTLTADRLNFNVPATGAVKSTTWGKYGVSYFSYDFGVPHHDDVLCFGFNCGGPEYDPAHVQWTQAFENYYTTSEGRTQSEFYFTACLPNGGLCSRPFSLDFYHDSGATQVGISSASFFIANPSQSNMWLRAFTSDTAGDLVLYGNSGINYSGTREFMDSRYGIGLIGSTSTTNWSLFSGGINGETLNIFKYSDLSQPLTIKIGSLGSGFRIGSSQRMQVSGNGIDYADIQTVGEDGAINVSAVKVNGVKVVGVPCVSIDDVIGTGIGGVGESGQVDHSKTINKILQCLRDHGLLASE